MNVEVYRKNAKSPPYACKVHKKKSECDKHVDCEWKNNRECVRRPGVSKGWRYKFSNNPEGQLQQKDSETHETNQELKKITQQLNNFSFRYNPDWDQPVPKIHRRVIGKGTYGMAFFPALPCDTNYQPSNYIGKIFWSANKSSDEWNKTNFISNIEKDTTQKYFTYSIDRCSVPFPTGIQELDTWVRDNRTNNNMNPNVKTVEQHFMEYSGMTLFEYLDGYYYTQNTITIYELLKITENYFYGIDYMDKHGYAHCDLKGNNVVVSNTKRARIIDFGLSVKHSDFYTNDNVLYGTPYWNISAPEFICNLVLDPSGNYYSYIDYLRSETFNDEESEMYKHYVNFVKQPDGTLRNITTEVENEFDTMSKGMNIDPQTSMAYMKQHNSHRKQDVYSLGLMILRIVSINGKRSSSLEDREVADAFHILMHGMLYPTPEKRMTIKEAIVKLRFIIDKAEKYNKDHPNDTKTYGQNPFKANQDPGSMLNIFKQKFGRVINNNKLAKLLRYINTLL